MEPGMPREAGMELIVNYGDKTARLAQKTVNIPPNF